MSKFSVKSLRSFKYVEKNKIWYGISIGVILLGVIFLLIFGMNLGIDCTGGSEVVVNIEDSYADLHQDEIDRVIQDVFDAHKLEVENAQYSSLTGGGKSFEYKFQIKVDGKKVSDEEFTYLFQGNKEDDNDNGVVGEIKDAILAIEDIGLSSDDNFVNFHVVTGSASSDLIKNTVLAVVIASALILVYIAFRFTFSTGLAAVICLLHDVCIMIALSVIFRIQINSTFVAAVITIIGYSINATIVIFDRIRENSRMSMYKDADPALVADVSIGQTMTRSIYTTLTTLFTIAALAFIPSLSEFALPIIFGLISGAYSSIFLSGSLWVSFTGIGKKILKDKKTYKGKKKAEPKPAAEEN